MGKKRSSSGAVGWVVLLAVVAVGGYAYSHFHQQAQTTAPSPAATTASTGQAADAGQNKPSGTNSTPASKPNDATTASQQSNPSNDQTSASGSDVIQFQAYSGSGTLSLLNRGVKNNMFEIEHLDWTDANKTLMVVGKMQATSGVAYMRVRDANRDILQPETVLQPQPGAPDWSNITGEIPLDPSYQDKVLDVEIYQKSSNGSHTNLLKFQIQPQ